MTNFVPIRTWLCAVSVAMLGATGALAANDASPRLDPAAVLAPFLPGDAFAVGYVDLQALNPVALTGELASLAGLPEAAGQELRTRAQVAKTMLDGVRASGVRTVYAVAGLADVSAVAGPLVIVEVNKPGDLEAAEGALRAGLQILGQPTRATESKLLIERHASGVLLVGTRATLDRYQSIRPTARPDLVEPVARIAKGGAAVALVFNPGADFRRVMRELWPPMPDWLPQFKPLTGQFLADRFRYDELAVHVAPQMSIRWAAQMADPEAAEVVAQMIRDLPAAIKRAAQEEDVPDEVRTLTGPLSELLAPRVEDARVTLRIDSNDPRLASLRQAMALAAADAMQSSRRLRQMQDLKQLALAMLVYCNSNKHRLPPAAICDADGQPLLSWRVAVLPYLEQESLYKQFHLDEPWDSPHNLELVKKMPVIFAEPGDRELAQEGKTTYLVPVGPGTVFDTTEGVGLRDITDGTSKTIMIVATAPDQAVEWTRPVDWQVDMEHPLAGLTQAGRDRFVAAICDGSVHVIPANVDPAVLRAMLTRAGGEVVDWP